MSRVEIGSKYEGPAWDRPCLRQMPRQWMLEETRPEPVKWERWMTVLLALFLLVSCAQTVRMVMA